MKANKIVRLTTAVALVGILIVGSAWGYNDQDGRRDRAGHGKFDAQRGLNLTDVQKKEMKDLRISFTREMMPVKNKIGIKMAELKAASTGDNIDTKKVNKLLEEIGALKTEIAQKRFANKLKMRSLLSDDQKVMFDAHAGRGHKGGHGKAMRQGRQPRHGDARKGMRRQGGQERRFGGADANGDVDVENDIQG